MLRGLGSAQIDQPSRLSVLVLDSEVQMDAVLDLLQFRHLVDGDVRPTALALQEDKFAIIVLNR